VVHDTHIFGLFPRETWLRLLLEAGFQPRAAADPWGREVFVGVRDPGAASGKLSCGGLAVESQDDH
jgi:hypothetical protein